MRNKKVLNLATKLSDLAKWQNMLFLRYMQLGVASFFLTFCLSG